MSVLWTVVFQSKNVWGHECFRAVQKAKVCASRFKS